MKIKKHTGSAVMRTLIFISAGLTVFTLLFLIAYILINGIPNIKPELFALKWNTENQSMLPAIINTVYITVLTLLLAVPTGIAAAIYLVEYSSRRATVLVRIIRVTTETLAGIPSIVYGLFGFLAFVLALGWDYSMISGVITLAIMVLPTIIRTTEEALLAVPQSYREGSFGLGAGKLTTVFKIILPSAMPGILSGIILAIGRIVGESAALIFTAGTTAKASGNLFDSARTLSVHLYCLLSEGLYTKQAYATAVVLLVMVIIINQGANFAAKKLARGTK